MRPYLQVSIAAHHDGVAVTWTTATEVSGVRRKVSAHRKVLPLQEPYTWSQALRSAAALLQREATRQERTPPPPGAVGAP